MKSFVKNLDGNMNPTPLVTVNDDLSQYFINSIRFALQNYTLNSKKSLKYPVSFLKKSIPGLTVP
jgi:hypothetical protein